MNKYINQNALIEFANNHKDKQIDANDIARFPCADVVPKSEVDELKKIYKKYNKAIRHERVEVAREIFAEIESLLKRTCEKGYCGSISDLFAELKKKYTGEQC